MNTQTPIAGYIVETQYWEQPEQNSTKSFIDADLLTARQAAHNYAKTLVAQKPPTDVLDITIHLVEFDGEAVTTPYIAQVFNQRSHRSEHTAEEDAITINVAMESVRDEQDLFSSINLTIDPTAVDEAFESAEAVRKSLSELTYEYEYFRSYNHPPGLGYVRLTALGPTVLAPHELNGVDTDLNACSVAELAEMRKQLRRCTPWWSFWLIYDALAHSSSLIGSYNETYAPAGQHLTFSTKIMPDE